jgi:hypothetical protein
MLYQKANALKKMPKQLQDWQGLFGIRGNLIHFLRRHAPPSYLTATARPFCRLAACAA